MTNAYDAFADFPDKPWNLLAIANAMAGLIYRHGQTATADLSEVPAQNITTTVNSLGATTTTVVVPSPFLPLTQVLRDAVAAHSADLSSASSESSASSVKFMAGRSRTSQAMD